MHEGAAVACTISLSSSFVASAINETRSLPVKLDDILSSSICAVHTMPVGETQAASRIEEGVGVPLRVHVEEAQAVAHPTMQQVRLREI
jgi:hypothetical protein